DGDVATLGAPTLPDWLTLTDNGDGTGTLTGTPGDEHVGDHEVVLEAADPNALTAQQSFTVSVVTAGVPVFDSAPVVTATAGTAYAYPIAATDPDGDAVTISAPVLPDWLALADNGDGTWTLAGTPGDEHVGDHAV